MQLNYFLISIFLIFGCIQLDGMSYWELAKSYFMPLNPEQKLQREFYYLLQQHSFASAFKLFQTIYFQSDSKQQEIIKKTIASTIQSIPFWNSSYDQNNFIHAFLKPFADNSLSLAIDIFKMLNLDLIDYLLYTTKNRDLAQIIISVDHFPEYIIHLAKDILNETKIISPTLLHRQQHWRPLTYRDKFFDDPELKNLYASFSSKEQELNQQGYYTFVHGQRRDFYLPQKLYTHLWELRKKRPLKDFFFIHLKDLIETEEAKSKENILRETLHTTGAAHHRNKILFMNYAFFANSKNLGSSSANYVASNFSLSPFFLSVEEPFKLLGYEWIYKKHFQEIKQLSQDFNNLSRHGNMLMIAIPKEMINQLVYICDANGTHTPLTKKDGTKITDIRIAMETLLKNPETLADSDQIEFCLIMTQVKGGLDPSTGIQIYPLLSGDPEKLKTLQAREKILLDKIMADVKEAEKQQDLHRAAKITGHVTESAQAK